MNIVIAIILGTLVFLYTKGIIEEVKFRKVVKKSLPLNHHFFFKGLPFWSKVINYLILVVLLPALGIMVILCEFKNIDPTKHSLLAIAEKVNDKNLSREIVDYLANRKE